MWHFPAWCVTSEAGLDARCAWCWVYIQSSRSCDQCWMQNKGFKIRYDTHHRGKLAKGVSSMDTSLLWDVHPHDRSSLDDTFVSQMDT